MIFSNALKAPPFTNYRRPIIQFGASDVPEGVPKKFADRWEELPSCCRKFYESPGGGGCCAGQSEPQPAVMNQPVQPKKDDNVIDASFLSQPPKNKVMRFLTNVVDWFKEMFRVLSEDLKSLFIK